MNTVYWYVLSETVNGLTGVMLELTYVEFSVFM
jgi:hypothetical protein